MGSGVAEVSIRDLYFILQPDTPGECALFISITEADNSGPQKRARMGEEVKN